MLYIFDLGNVIVDIDFNRVLGVWSDLGRVPLATLQSRFQMGESFDQHERGEISDKEFARQICDELELPLSFEQFAAGWQAVFVGVRPDVIAIMHQLREQGERVVILSNTNNLHCQFWPEQYPEVRAAADKIYLSQEMGLRKPDPAIYQRLLNEEETAAAEAIYFDDNPENIEAARALGIHSLHITDNSVIPAFFADRMPDGRR
ncbi:glucose-1-phosphatase [Erwinia amylovora]|uniref:Acyl-CoA dehydrogenase family member 10 (ACAD-10) n=4 Tax=Erwinia amylovora TaxID=552 RepID=A0A830ZPA6_ERWAM|nr:glucose-1-phosphatase [Erwinia amylovora]CBX78861.1 Acyl-CoA dehydrogenase family member 10 (ACAD-10) [Erwinia amylovora ATCC BAA-2158]CDK13659.1 Acyl-CoA dehydrogenase family member 10 (ACAD-10) [Erwinia amylovora LA635]CDK17026.1 Acyl-CoA dehydrogenase family member 10 (ACAD-10) [Erwinia amylovora LA636]CDK20395.1 Acyl-CoA dehydrogenase family member 10 (ACAD-10) [Erwinia amylovora LA637]ATZ10011.1 glucose-1-phosphatase [Erwinia amylovora]